LPCYSCNHDIELHQITVMAPRDIPDATVESSALDLEGLSSATVQTRLDAIGWGPYHLLVMMCVGFAMLTESLEMGALAPMHTALAHSYGLSDATRSALPAMIFSGSALGLVVAAPLSDHYGRKGAILMSLVTIAVVMFATASLPDSASAQTILALRFIAGAAGAVPIPACFALAVESCPRANRASLVFGICFLSSMGYLIAAIGVKVFMPHFGEVSTDTWRGFCFFTAIVAGVSVPFMTLLHESPCFLAASGDMDRCVLTLDAIAERNGRPPLRSILSPDVVRQSPAVDEEGWCSALLNSTWAVLSSYFWLIAVLTIIDSCRAFFVSGSAYLWKDLFYQVFDEENESSYASPSNLNIFASISPLVGLILAERVVHIGVRRLTFMASMVATCALVSLTRSGIRASPWSLLTCIVMAKITYGPLGTCVALLKAESFPTTVRVSAFSIISIGSKYFCALAPTLVEILKGSEAADSWTDESLSSYLIALALAVLTTGVLALAVPGSEGNGMPLCDQSGNKTPSPIKDVTSYGSTILSDGHGSGGSI